MSSPAPESDQQLARRAATGEQAALDAWVKLCWPRLVGYLRFLQVPECDIDDVAQDVLAKVLTNLKKWADGRFTWVMTIARNTVYDRNPKKRARTTADDDMVELVDPRRVSEPDASDRFRHCWGLLADEHKEVLCERADGASYEELAAMLGITVGTVKSRLNRGRKELADCLGPYAE